MTDEMRDNLAAMLKAQGADDAGVAKMLGLVDDAKARLAEADRERDDALGLLVFKALHEYPGYDEQWAALPAEGRRDYVAAAKAVEAKVEAECDEILTETQDELEAEQSARERLEDALDEIERVIAKVRGGGK